MYIQYIHAYICTRVHTYVLQSYMYNIHGMYIPRYLHSPLTTSMKCAFNSSRSGGEWGTSAGDPWLFHSTVLSVVVNDGVSVKWPSMSPVSGCPSTVCTGWEGLLGVAFIYALQACTIYFTKLSFISHFTETPSIIDNNRLYSWQKQSGITCRSPQAVHRWSGKHILE